MQNKNNRDRLEAGPGDQGGLTSPQSQGCISLSRADTMLHHLIDSDPHNAVRDALEDVPPPSMVTTCCHPTCPKIIEWNGRGRPPRFCSTNCRAAFARERRGLQSELAAYERLMTCEHTSAEGHRLTLRMTALKMRLHRYPSPAS